MSNSYVSEAVNSMSTFVNTFSRKDEEFVKEMAKEHRTLQQSFTRLCWAWIEFTASDEYRYDGRNHQSHDISKEVLGAFKEYVRTEKKFDGATLEMMAKPSGYLGFI
jgi:hypothetical protein